MKLKLTNSNINKLQPSTNVYKAWDTEIANFFIKVRPSGRMTYGVFYRFNNKAREYTLGKHGNITPKQARNLALKAVGQIADGTDIQKEKQEAKARDSLRQDQLLGVFIEEKYKPWVLNTHKSGQATIDKIEYNFKQWFDKPLYEISKAMVTEWRSKKLQNDIKPATINRNLSCLKAAMAKAVEWDIIENHPLSKLKPLKEVTDPNVRYLDKHEEKRLRDALSARDLIAKEKRSKCNKWRYDRGYPLFPEHKTDYPTDYLSPMVILAMNTGLRRGELFNLCWDDIDLKSTTPLLIVRAAATKSSKTRYIPLNSEAVALLKKWKEINPTEGFVFPSTDGSKLTSIKKSWDTILTKAKISNFRFHDLRHHFASKLVTRGADLNTVRELLGHHNIKMTLRYAHLAPEHKANTVSLLVD
ncbi:tyrosine-type recombinase/integrase [Neptuniibacter sp. QD37_11]|uniref:phage integrase n=1 Tax=Neptuniibacter sp. QD37_11 TaxID=3398209 RepID=UPI0039F49AC2